MCTEVDWEAGAHADFFLCSNSRPLLRRLTLWEEGLKEKLTKEPESRAVWSLKARERLFPNSKFSIAMVEEESSI